MTEDKCCRVFSEAGFRIIESFLSKDVRDFRQNEGCSPREWRRTAMASLSNMEPKNMKEGD